MKTPDLSKVLAAVVDNVGGITAADLLGRRRTEPLASARQMAMYFLRHAYGWSYSSIGRAIGGRDHGTVLHGVRATSDRMDVESKWRGHAKAIADQLQMQPGIQLP